MHISRLSALAFAPALAMALVTAAGALPARAIVINACYNKTTGALRVAPSAASCTIHEKFLSWNQQGPQGIQGPAGPKGAKGDPGAAGAPGPEGPPVTFRGAWKSTTAYVVGDAVSEGTSSYIALMASTNVNPATDFTANGGHWGQLAAGSVPANLNALSGALSTTQGIAYLGATRFISAACSNMDIGDVILSVNGYGTGAMPADGRLLPINLYTALFSLIGTNFGGNGTTNFGLPDLRPFAPKGLQYSICYEGIFPGQN